MIFPNLGPKYYDQSESSREMLARMETFYNQALTMNLAFWAEADTDYRFYAGDQSLWSDLYGNVRSAQNKTFNFNRIRRSIDMVSGYQRRNRKSISAVPVETGDQQTTDDLTDTLLWLDQQENYSDTLSRGFNGALVTGMNLLQVWVDYREDPISGDIRVTNNAYNTFMIDPFFREPDMSDCNGVWKRSFLSKREVCSLLPSMATEIADMQGYNNRDGKFQFMPESYNYNQQSLLTYDEYYYKDFRTRRILIDTESGEFVEWRSKDEDKLREFLNKFPKVKLSRDEIPTVKLAIVVNGRIMYDGPQPIGLDCYPFIPVLGYFNPEIPYYNWRIQGMVRGLRDAQYLYNRRKVIELDILESQINSGWKIKENALVNFDDAFNTGQGKPFVLKEEAQMSDVEKILPGDIPPSMIRLSEILGEEISQISGVNEELLGSAVDDKAGVLAMMRQGAGLTTLQKLFDQLDLSQKLLGRMLIKVIQNNYTPGKMRRILGREPSERFYDKTFGKYDCAVEEGFNTTTQKQMQFAQLLQLQEVGVPIPPSTLVEAATLQKKNELIQAIEQQQQAQAQAQQQQMQQQMQLQAAQVNLANASASAEEGLNIERISRVNENFALAEERKSEAERQHMAGLLDLTKALAQIEALDISALEKLVTLAQVAKQTEALQAEKQEAQQLPIPEQQLTPMPHPVEAPKAPEGLPPEHNVQI